MKSLSLLIMVILLFGCATTSKVTVEQLTEVEKKLDAIELDVSDNKIKIDVLYKNDDVSLTEKILREKIADIEAELHNMKQDIEIQKTSLKPLEKEETEQVLKKIEQPVKKISVQRKKKKSVSDMYEEARNAYTSGRMSIASSLFSKIVTLYPTHELASNAQYWYSETFYDKKNYLVAIEEFQKVVDYYHSSTKAPDAQIKIGFCYSKLGKIDQAILEWKRIKKDYPEYKRHDFVKKLIEDAN